MDLLTQPHVAKITKQLIEQELTNVVRDHTYKLIWDSELKGFGVRLSPQSRVYPHGKASYVLQKYERGRGSKKVRHTLGAYPELDVSKARDKAVTIIAQIRNGQYISSREKNKRINQLRAEQAKQLTFEEVFELHYKRSHKKGRYWDRDIPYVFNADILPVFGKLPINSITKADCRALVREKEKTSKSAALIIYLRLRPLFGFAVSEDIIAANPMDGVVAPPKSKGRERVLDKDEIKAYWKAADELSGNSFGYFFRLLLLTGQRRNEVAGMQWDELNLDEGTWTIASSRAKNGKAHIVHLNLLALEIISQIPRRHPKFVFTKTQYNHINGFGAAKTKLDTLMCNHLGRDFPHFTLHDVRRTFTTKLAELGIGTDIADRILNHVSGSVGGVKGIYQRYEFLPQRKEAMFIWNKYIQDVIIPS